MSYLDPERCTGVSPASPKVVVGLDFGTTFSGSVYSTENNTIAMSVCSPGITVADSNSKVPTALLWRDDANCWEFGRAAFEGYKYLVQAAPDGSAVPGSLFTDFKMALQDKVAGMNDILVKSTGGMPKIVPVIVLITEVLRNLKNGALKRMKQGWFGCCDNVIIQWVLAVPAIWNDFGKALMRQAAVNAGLIADVTSSNLTIVLEPEAAALAVHLGQTALRLLTQGKLFMTLDCGGGTIDITVHEVVQTEPHLQLKAVVVPTGGPWGGNYVNQEFEKFIRELLGEDLFQDYVNGPDPIATADVRAAFDAAKCNFTPGEEPARINLSHVLESRGQLSNLAEAFNTAHPEKPILKTSRTENLLRNSRLPMSSELMLSFFEPCMAQTVRAVRESLDKAPGVSAIILVGGFGASRVMIERIKAEFDTYQFHNNPTGLRVISPDPNPRPQAAIVQGAVYFGLYRNIVVSRLAPCTYGIALEISGVADSFQVLVLKGQELRFDRRFSQVCGPSSPQQTIIRWRLFRSTCDTEPRLVSDRGVEAVGAVEVPCPAHEDQTQRMQTAHFVFGGTEIVVTVTSAQEVVERRVSFTLPELKSIAPTNTAD
jgi:molecular chaperone DnaK (HSP70)